MSNRNALGATLVAPGQLLTFYVDDPEDPSHYESVVLYVLKEFNLSAQMAEFYPTLLQSPEHLMSESAMGLFVTYLIELGYVEQPASSLVHFGTTGRVPQRLLHEYRHSLNPLKQQLQQIEDYVHDRHLGVYVSGGRYINLIHPDHCPVELLAVLHRQGEQVGILRMGVLMDRGEPLLRPEDLPYIQEPLQALVRKATPDADIVVDRVYLSYQPTEVPASVRPETRYNRRRHG